MRANLPRVHTGLLHTLVLLWSSSLTLPADAAVLNVEVRAADGKPVADAVVSVHAPGAEHETRPSTAQAIMDQKNKQFVPQVLAVRAGTAVYFPNSDDIRHQVYSFSRPKRFEIKLYTGTPSEPVMFDRPGVVVLGCNIHDWMMGYVYVSDTPHFLKSGADGIARFESLPPGRYRARVWHPRLDGGRREQSRPVELSVQRPARIRFDLKLAKPAANQQPPTLLQEKFRRFR